MERQCENKLCFCLHQVKFVSFSKQAVDALKCDLGLLPK